MADLVRAQRLLALRYGAVLALLLAALPVTLLTWNAPPPGWPSGWLPPTWAVLPLLSLVTLWWIARRHARRATALEDRWRPAPP